MVTDNLNKGQFQHGALVVMIYRRCICAHNINTPSRIYYTLESFLGNQAQTVSSNWQVRFVPTKIIVAVRIHYHLLFKVVDEITLLTLDDNQKPSFYFFNYNSLMQPSRSYNQATSMSYNSHRYTYWHYFYSTNPSRVANFQTIVCDLRLFVILQTFLLLFLYMLKAKTFLHIPSQNHQHAPQKSRTLTILSKKFCDSRPTREKRPHPAGSSCAWAGLQPAVKRTLSTS